MSTATEPDVTDYTAEPLLYSLREYSTVVSGSTTVSAFPATNPVRESGPDD